MTVSRRVGLSFEYYGKTGLFGGTSGGGQVHQFYPGVDLRLGDDIELNMGVGVGTTAAANRLVLKSRFEVPLGR